MISCSEYERERNVGIILDGIYRISFLFLFLLELQACLDHRRDIFFLSHQRSVEECEGSSREHSLLQTFECPVLGKDEGHRTGSLVLFLDRTVNV